MTYFFPILSEITQMGLISSFLLWLPPIVFKFKPSIRTLILLLPRQDMLKVAWFKACTELKLFQPFSVNRAYWEELNAKLPKQVEDDHH
jgi:hypothetical protein